MAWGRSQHRQLTPGVGGRLGDRPRPGACWLPWVTLVRDGAPRDPEEMVVWPCRPWADQPAEAPPAPAPSTPGASGPDAPAPFPYTVDTQAPL